MVNWVIIQKNFILLYFLLRTKQLTCSCKKVIKDGGLSTGGWLSEVPHR